jgi:hypothetical protein
MSVYLKEPFIQFVTPKFWHITWLMKLLTVVLFVISNIQKNPAIWTILLFKTWPIFVLAK